MVSTFRASCHSAARLLGAVALLATGLFLGAGAPGRAQDPGAPGAVVATVNGHTLTEAEFARRCERLVGGQTDTAVGWVALKDWVQQTLAEDEATSRRLIPTQTEITRRVDALRKQWEFRGGKFVEWLAEHGRTVDTVRADVRQQLIAENLLTEGVKVNDSEALVFYGSNKEVYGIPEQLKASRITVREKDAMSKVEAALKKGTEFDIIAREHSVDPFSLSGGEITGSFDADPEAGGPLEPEVMEKTLKLAKGKIAGPIKVKDYWVWVRLEDRIPARNPPIADVQDLVMANLKVQKGGAARLQAAQARLVQIQKQAKIEVMRPEYRGLPGVLQGAGAPTGIAAPPGKGM
jgi:foldase protein PrsA